MKTIVLFLLLTICNVSFGKEEKMHNAVVKNDISLVKEAIKKDIKNLEQRDFNGKTPLMLATEMNRVEIAKFLIESGADVNAKDKKNDSPYLYAGAHGYLEILKMTLNHGADLKSVNRFGGTALIPAAEKGHPQAVKLLLAAGVDANHINHLGWTALMEAVVLSQGGKVHQEIARLLIKGGANVNIPDKEGITPLKHAEKRGQKEMVKILKEAGGR